METGNIKKTPLNAVHREFGGRMVEFAGWEMPVQYEAILSEHHHTRKAVSVFDTCHMGEFMFRGDPGKAGLERLVTVPCGNMKPGRCRYGFALNEAGGVIDDLVVYRISGDEWMVVVNAGDIEGDFGHFRGGLASGTDFTNRSEALGKIDLQGPLAPSIIKRLPGAEGAAGLGYYSFGTFDLLGERVIISRTGYTGEAGFEFYIGAGKVERLWRRLLGFSEVRPAGLGARDTLRMEMGYPLYGSDLDRNTTPVEAGLDRFIPFNKDFLGRESLLSQKRDGTKKSLVGLAADSRRSPRHGNGIWLDGREVGKVTSGGFAPSLEKGIALGYVEPAAAKSPGPLIIRGEKAEIEARVAPLPFYKCGSARG